MTEKGKPETNYRTFGDTVGARAFPDAIDVDLDVIRGKQILVHDVQFKKMQFGEVAIMLYDIPADDRTNLTTLVGGSVVREKLRDAKQQRLFPLLGTIDMERGKTYYDII